MGKKSNDPNVSEHLAALQSLASGSGMPFGCYLPGKQIMCRFGFSYLVIFRLQKNCLRHLIVSGVSISKHFGRCLLFALFSASWFVTHSFSAFTVFLLTFFWSRDFVSCSTKSRARGGSNAKLWYAPSSFQSVYLPQRPDSEWHSYKQWVRDLMCTVQTSCHDLGTWTWLKNKHLACINIWCVFLVRMLCPFAIFL